MTLRDCGIVSVAVVGVALEVGIEPTVRHGADLGYLPIVATDACGAGDPAAGERTLPTLASTGGVLLTDAAACARARPPIAQRSSQGTEATAGGGSLDRRVGELAFGGLAGIGEAERILLQATGCRPAGSARRPAREVMVRLVVDGADHDPRCRPRNTASALGVSVCEHARRGVFTRVASGGTAVEQLRIRGAGHTWFGPGTSPPDDALDATAETWRFFAAHPRRN
jgi:hypothetical protein